MKIRANPRSNKTANQVTTTCLRHRRSKSRLQNQAVSGAVCSDGILPCPAICFSRQLPRLKQHQPPQTQAKLLPVSTSLLRIGQDLVMNLLVVMKNRQSTSPQPMPLPFIHPSRSQKFGLSVSQIDRTSRRRCAIRTIASMLLRRFIRNLLNRYAQTQSFVRPYPCSPIVSYHRHQPTTDFRIRAAYPYRPTTRT